MEIVMSDIGAVLLGGPFSRPSDRQEQKVTTRLDTIKVPYLNGYEHFRYEGESMDVNDELMPVFRWVMRTALAE
jgi:uncharacterized protein DUF5988